MNRKLARSAVAVVAVLTATVVAVPVASAAPRDDSPPKANGANGNALGNAQARGKARARARAKARARARGRAKLTGRSTIKAMTRNLYLGTDLIPIALAPSLAEFEQAASAGFDQVQATDFPARAKLIAREIKRTKPDLIGLQEAALWRTGPKDGVSGNATTVAYDYIKLLRRELRRQGQRYGVASVTREADIEGPTAEDFDVRLTMRDAILVRKRPGLRVVGRGGDNYESLLQLPTQAGTFTSTRGYAYADMVLKTRSGKGKRKRVKTHRFRFVDTHLEAYGDEIREAQAAELVGPDGPVAGRKTVIVAGDFNSDPAEGQPQPEAWHIVESSSLRDTWPWLYPNRPGHSCCTRGPALMDPPRPSPFDHRIDDIFAQGALRPLNARIVGTNPATSRTRSGLWASDHGGLVTKFKLR